jgi:hypothetical protein
MTATVVQNYSAEQTTTAVEMYGNGVSVETIAAELGKSVRSVVAKLSREGVYVAKSKQTGATRVTKAALITAIAAKVGSTDEALESLEKATKEALEILAAAL